MEEYSDTEAEPIEPETELVAENSCSTSNQDPLVCCSSDNSLPCNKAETKLKPLFEFISAGDVNACSEIIASLEPKQLNKRRNMKHSQYIEVIATPLLAAVILRKPDIVELLLTKQVNIEKKGFYQDFKTFYTVTPLLKAIMNSDVKIVEMLLDKGANVHAEVSGPKIAEEEGYYCQYSRVLHPLNVAMSMGIGMFKLVCRNASMSLEYGEMNHNCLCYAISHYLSDPEIVDPSFIQYIVQRGGKICYRRNDKLPCIYLQNLILALIQVHYSTKADTSSEIDIVCNEEHIAVVELLSCTEYVHTDSNFYHIVGKCCKHLLGIMLSTKSPLKFRCDKAERYYKWVTSCSKTPSRLVDISRCAIRSLILDITPDKCKALPLPQPLIDFVSLKTNLPVVNNDRGGVSIL